MTTFNPTGTLLVAFDNGMVKAWQSSVSEERRNRLNELNAITGGKKKGGKGGRSKRNQMQYSFDDMGELQFDLLDTFDMFYNPHGKPDYSDEDAEQDDKTYRVSAIPFAKQFANLCFDLCFIVQEPP